MASSSSNVKVGSLAEEWEAFEGFSVAPKRDCVHVGDASFVVTSALQGSLDGDGSGGTDGGKMGLEKTFEKLATCSDCGDTQETWVCLQCGASKCGRFRQAHMVQHVSSEDEGCGGVIAMSAADLSVWCFQCDAYITHDKLEQPFRELHHLKFGYYPDASLHKFH